MIETSTLQGIAAAFSILVSASILITPVRKWIWLRLKNMFGRTSRLLEEHMLREEETLSRIEKELHPNGGASLADKINLILEDQKGILYRMEDFDAFTRAQLNIHPTALYRANAEGKWREINREFSRLFGVSFLEVEGEGWVNLLAPSNRDKVFDKWTKAVDSQREFSEDVVFITATGREFTAHIHVFRERDRHGGTRGYLGMITPIGEDGECTCTVCPYRAKT